MMRVLVAGVIAGFLSHVALAVTPGLDPIENMCHRFDHQCTSSAPGNYFNGSDWI